MRDHRRKGRESRRRAGRSQRTGPAGKHDRSGNEGCKRGCGGLRGGVGELGGGKKLESRRMGNGGEKKQGDAESEMPGEGEKVCYGYGGHTGIDLVELVGFLGGFREVGELGGDSFLYRSAGGKE